MPLDEFPLLQNNTRLLRHKDVLYKIKVKYEEPTDGCNSKTFSRKKAHSQIENTFRALLYIIQRENVLDLKPIQTEDFHITIATAPWSFCKKYGFTQNGKELKAYPLQFEFRIKILDSYNPIEKAVDVNTETIKSESEEVTKDSNEVHSKAKEVVVNTAVASGSRFTRNNTGSLMFGGRKVLSKENENHNQSGNENGIIKVDDGMSKDSEAHLVEDRKISKRKYKSTEDGSTENQLKRLRSSDKGLEVERFHNRNNSNRLVSPRHPEHRLRPRKSKDSGIIGMGNRHSERLRLKESSVYTESSSESSQPENEEKKTKLKKPANTQTIHNKDKKDLSDSESSNRHVNIDKKHKVLKSDLDTCKTRKKRENLNKHSNVESASETETEEKGKQYRIPQGKGRAMNNSTVKAKARLNENGDVNMIELSQDDKSKKHKLYTNSGSSDFIESQQSGDKGMPMNSPRVSTVLPRKRAKTQPDFQSPRTTRQQTLVRSPVDQVDLIASSRPASHHHALDEESQRIQRMRQQAPIQTYRNIMLAQSRDRHMIEEAERAETNKLQQLYEPTEVRRSTRLQEKEDNKSFWEKLASFFTPVKNMVTGNRRRWSDIH